jgi:hypothetical protein
MDDWMDLKAYSNQTISSGHYNSIRKEGSPTSTKIQNFEIFWYDLVLKHFAKI